MTKTLLKKDADFKKMSVKRVGSLLCPSLGFQARDFGGRRARQLAGHVGGLHKARARRARVIGQFCRAVATYSIS